MNPDLRARIQSHIDSNDVVLFMKGTRQMPQCGFSATVVQILDSLVDDYETVNVLADGDIRQGIKEYSDWPTIPQLYVKGEFLGGCDIVKDMFESGELQGSLGVEVKEVPPPQITISEAAAAALKGALQSDQEFVRLEIDGRYNHGLSVGPRGGGDVAVEASGVTILVDRMSAKRAEGVSIDFVDTPEGKAFKIDNPNEPPKVKPLSVQALKERLDESNDLHLYDVRTVAEREIAKIEGSVLLDREAQDAIMKLPKDTPLYFQCHSGRRSMQAAEFFINQGFKEVYNIEGGIDAWSRDIDPDVPRYD